MFSTFYIFSTEKKEKFSTKWKMDLQAISDCDEVVYGEYLQKIQKLWN